MTLAGIYTFASTLMHALAERQCTPEQSRANEALERLNAASDRVIANASTDPLRDALNNMAENR